jgi:peptidoglycan/xylan/chitin deacetylase (PgdA/CDA1 family)
MPDDIARRTARQRAAIATATGTATDGVAISDEDRGGREPPRCLVVMYHYVQDRRLVDQMDLGSSGERLRAMSPSAFREQIERLCREMEPIDWPTLFAATRGRASLPTRCFLPTFDDGLADHFNVVMPILHELGVRGAFFVPGSILAGHDLLAAHAIHLLLLRLGAGRFQSELEGALAKSAVGARILREIDADGERIQHLARATYDYESGDRARLKYLLTMVLPIDVRRQVVTALFKEHVGAPRRWARHWYLGWDELVALQSAGHTIGGHGFAHEPYARLASVEVEKDARRSATILNDGLGSDIRPFSFPYGSFDDGAVDAVRAAGFAQAFTTECRRLSVEDEPFRLPRVDTIRVDATLKEPVPCAPT